jgi:uncharacterized damage-inducible protein DinB
MQLPVELRALIAQLDNADADARSMVNGLSEELGHWSPSPGSWSASECLHHLALTNHAYIAAMKPAADRARVRGRLRSRPAKPGFVGSWFLRSIEPPVKTRFKAPPTIQPHHAPPLAEAFAAFTASQQPVREFLLTNADLDLATIHFPNPFIRGVRFSLATGLHVIPAHDRRHLCQARNALQQAEASRH